MVLLDKAYKNIGSNANSAKVSGNFEGARDLNSLRGSLLDAITDGDSSHPYRQALNAYSGASDTQNALKAGQMAFGQDARITGRTFNELSDGDKQFYQIGFADALQKKLNSASESRDAVKVIYGNNNIRDSIGHVFGRDAAEKFDGAMKSETAMNQTSNFLTSGSQTANKQGDIVKPALLKQVLADSVTGGLAGFMGGGPHGALVAGVGTPLANLASHAVGEALSKHALSNPENAAMLGRLLTTPGNAGSDQLETVLNPLVAKSAARSARAAILGRALRASGPLAGVTAGSLTNRSNAR
jgi:hypothetical protein